MKRLILLFFIPFSCFAGGETDTSKSFYDMSLEELMNIKISIASVKEMTPDESPGIVTLITREEIQNSGARDLIDIFRLVPGIDFGGEVDGVVGIGIRGNWASEGKVLLLLDGMELNEGLYNTIQLGNHYPVENIERIEIIRGPGSAMYGGTAEYAVINIITRNHEHLNGIEASASYGQMSRTFGERNFTLTTAGKNKDFNYSATGFISDAVRSQETFTDFYGSSYDMKDHSGLQSKSFNVNLGYKTLQVKSFVDLYTIHTQDGYEQIFTRDYPTYFNSFHFNIQNKFRLSRNFYFIPEVEFKKQSPWSNDGDSYNDELSPFHIVSEKLTGRATLEYNASQNISFNGGAEYFKDYGKTKIQDEVFFSNQSETLSYSDYAVFGQAIIKSKIANIALGARYNDNSIYNSSFVPRLAITKVVNNFHAKILFSKAFRAPNIMNIDVNTSIKPENTTVWEFETGYRFSEIISGNFNLFHIHTDDIIVFYYDETINDDGYTNLEKMGTKGFETEWKFKIHKGFIGANYSFYLPLNKESIIPDYEVQTNHNALLGFAVHKINLFGNMKLNHEVIPGATISFYGPRYGISGMNSDGSTTYKLYHPAAFINVFVTKENLFAKNLSVRFGIYNVSDEKELYLPAYSIMRSPTPGKGREFNLKLAYSIPY